MDFQPKNCLKQYVFGFVNVHQLSPAAMETYTDFADEMTRMMNSKWEGTQQPDTYIGNVSKDKRVMIRYVFPQIYTTT